MDGRKAAEEIRKLEANVEQPKDIDPLRIDGRIPIFAVSASLYEHDRSNLARDFDGWILKPLGESATGISARGFANIRLHQSPGSTFCSPGSNEAISGNLCARSMGEGWFLARLVRLWRRFACPADHQMQSRLRSRKGLDRDVTRLGIGLAWLCARPATTHTIPCPPFLF
jgi:CheY-like chemotaxis protein